jgi:hypothetical protein
MSDTPTPQTDEQINGKPCTQFGLLAGMSLRNALVPSDFARQLERELAATKHLLHESLQREDRFYRELAAKDTEKYCFASCAFHAAQDAEIARLREAANAVVERWETPLWKDVKPTAHIIYALRDELAAQQQASK